MAYSDIQFLLDGVSSLASGNWKLATGSGGSGIVDAAQLVISKGSAKITSDLDWSALSTGIESLDILSTFLGDIGSAAGSLQLDADNSSDARVSFAGPGNLYLAASGGSDVITYFYMTATGRAYLTAGTFTNIRFGGGTLTVNESAAVTNAYLHGGASTIAYNSTDITVLDIDGGVHTIRRRAVGGAGNFRVTSGTCNYDVTTAESGWGEVRIGAAGTLNLISAGETCTDAYVDGVLDASKLKVPVIITNVYYGPNARVIPGTQLTITNHIRASGTSAACGFLPRPTT